MRHAIPTGSHSEVKKHKLGIFKKEQMCYTLWLDGTNKRKSFKQSGNGCSCAHIIRRANGSLRVKKDFEVSGGQYYDSGYMRKREVL